MHRAAVLLAALVGCGHAPRASTAAVPSPAESAEAPSPEPPSIEPPCASFDSLVALCAREGIPANACEPDARTGPSGGIDEAAVVSFVEEQEDGTSGSVVLVALRVGARWFVGASASGYDLGGTDTEVRNMSIEAAAGGLLITRLSTSTDDGGYSEDSTTIILVRAANGVPYVRYETLTGASSDDPYACQNMDEGPCEECAEQCPDEGQEACERACWNECECFSGSSYALPIAFEGPDRLRLGPTDVSDPPGNELPIYETAQTER